MMCCSVERLCAIVGVGLAVAALAQAAVAAPTLEREIIGQSPAGEPIAVWTLADRDASQGDPGDRPALVVIAGVQGHHQIGVKVAEAMGELLIQNHAEALAGRTVYIVPRVNPEGLARFVSGEGPRALSGRAPVARDADRDRRIDEDPPNDLNGDGMITMMRMPAPDDRFGIEPTHVIDADDPRIVREPGDDERATHAVMIEGVDDDGDGHFNEDGWGGASGGGVDFDMHFPTHWPEHEDGAGRVPLERPETRAIVEWLQARRNIAAAIVLGPHDTVVSTPPTGKYGPAGRVPQGIEEDDAGAYSLAAEAFEEITGITGTEPGPSRDGSLVQWTYADLGVYAFGTPVWVRPDLVKADEPDAEPEAEAEAEPEAQDAGPTPEDIEAADRADMAERGVGQMFIDVLYMTEAERAGMQAQMEGMSPAEQQDLMRQYSALPADVQARLGAIMSGGSDPGPSEELLASIGASADAGGRGRRSSSNAAGSGDAEWLAWIDERGEGGFVDWEPFEHPQLGAVEIGGFVPGVRVNPPEEQVDQLAEQQAAFAAAVLDMLPNVELGEPTVERVGGGVWRVGLTIRNTGTLPTKSAIGLKTGRLPGIVCVLDPDLDLGMNRIVSGSRAIRFDVIEGRGATERAEWLVVAEQGETVGLELRSPLFGTKRYALTMEDE